MIRYSEVMSYLNACATYISQNLLSSKPWYLNKLHSKMKTHLIVTADAPVPAPQHPPADGLLLPNRQ